MIKFLFSLFLSISLLGCQSTEDKSGNQQGEDIFDAAIENRKNLKPILIIDPRYPKDALSNGVEGTCKVKFDLSQDGGLVKPTNIQVVTCEPNGVFEQACISSVSKWVFNNLDSYNEPTDGLVTTCRFELEGV